MPYYTLVISVQFHDSSVALFEDDRLVYFIQTERMTRLKHDDNLDLKCLDYIYDNITKNVDFLVFFPNMAKRGSYWTEMFNIIRKKFKIKQIMHEQCLNFVKTIPRSKDEYMFFSHHCIHALSAFYMSPFDEAVCLVIDGSGSGYSLQHDDKNGILGIETTSIIEINKNYRRNCLYKKSIYGSVNIKNSIPAICFNNYRPDIDMETRFEKFPCVFDATTHLDIGMMYEIVSRHIRFNNGDAGKTMGLSAYGKENSSIPPFLIRGTILSDKNVFNSEGQLNRKVCPELFEDLTFQKKADIAFEVQKSLEKMFLHHAEFIKNNSKIKNLVISGGCALNILGISLIKKNYPEFNIFVDPIAHDATHAIGLGVQFYNMHKMKGELIKKNHFNSIYTGPKYNLAEMSSKIDQFISEH